MGCDIHFYVERQEENGWVPVRVSYDGRNYALFAILANVRNGYGFAGISTGEGFVPISMPRGLPFDVSPEIRAESDYWGVDGHSHSWLTVQELLAYNWEQEAIRYGVVPEKIYETLESGTAPESFSTAVMGIDVEKLSPEDMDALIAGVYERDEGKHYYTHVTWKTPYSWPVRGFLANTLPLLQSLGNPAQVRIVFWFDN